MITAVAAATVALLVPVAGQAGGAPSVAWSPTTSSSPPAAYDYGAVAAGQTPSQQFTLTNSGGSATGALKITVSHSPPFAITADACTGLSLGPKKSCKVTVQYSPSAAASDTGTLSASSPKPSAVGANLALKGAAPPPPVANDDGGFEMGPFELLTSFTGALLSNDTAGTAGDTLALHSVNGSTADVGTNIGLPSGAQLTVTANGTITHYCPCGAFPAGGQDSFTYNDIESNGLLSNTATVSITIL